ncbi:MAG: thiamine-phosphate kinase [Kordiimonas sp.]
MPDEFDLIAQYFAPLAGEAGLELKDDAACIKARPGYDCIVSKDILVEGTHFFEGANPFDLAFKALAVNVSDLAAKGAKPAIYFLGLSLPTTIEENWLKSFSAGLQVAQDSYPVELAGGDTTSTKGPITISITALGYVEESSMIKRSGAKVEDDVYVTGTLGDAAIGLKALQADPSASGYLVARYHRPQARLQIGLSLHGIANSAADVSDGLLADLGHICNASKVGVTIQQAKLPLSPSTEAALRENSSFADLVWSGGDDYEILFTSPRSNRQQIEQLSSEVAVPITRIGTVEQGEGVRLVDQSGNLVQVKNVGFQHFRQN